MKKIITMTVAVAIAGSLSLLFAGGNGEATFKKGGCPTCHHPTKDQLGSGLGPSLAMISTAYKGDKAGLVAFLNGKGAPRVAPKKFGIMKTQLRKIMKMSDADRDALADFILAN